MAHDERIRVRVKWGNVARAAVALAALALVVAWPRLGGDPPALPDDGAVPFAATTARATPDPAIRETRGGTDATVGEERRAGRGEAAPNAGSRAARRPRRAAADRARKRGGQEGRARRRSSAGRAQKRERKADGAKRRSGTSRRRRGRPLEAPADRTPPPVPSAPSPGATPVRAAPPHIAASPRATAAPSDPEFGFEG